MSRRCKAGQRARIIGSSVNRGKLVLVVRRYQGEEVSGAGWPEPLFPWVVTTLGAPLVWTGLDDGRKGHAMTIVVDDSQLQPLSDDDDGLSHETDQFLPASKRVVKTPAEMQGVHKPRVAFQTRCNSEVNGATRTKSQALTSESESL